MKNKFNKNNGFTIIEVVLVLAIAGLIFVMVFVALPQLQRSQRDTARKNDASVIAAQVTTFSSNNRGALPADASVIRPYLTGNLSENTDEKKLILENYKNTNGRVDFSGDDNTPTIFDKPVIVLGAQCDTTGPTGVNMKVGTTRQFIVVVRLESGNGVYYCHQD